MLVLSSFKLATFKKYIICTSNQENKQNIFPLTLFEGNFKGFYPAIRDWEVVHHTVWRDSSRFLYRSEIKAAAFESDFETLWQGEKDIYLVIFFSFDMGWKRTCPRLLGESNSDKTVFPSFYFMCFSRGRHIQFPRAHTQLSSSELFHVWRGHPSFWKGWNTFHMRKGLGLCSLEKKWVTW